MATRLAYNTARHHGENGTPGEIREEPSAAKKGQRSWPPTPRFEAWGFPRYSSSWGNSAFGSRLEVPVHDVEFQLAIDSFVAVLREVTENGFQLAGSLDANEFGGKALDVEASECRGFVPFDIH